MAYFIDPDLVYGFMAALLHSRFDDPKPTPLCHSEWLDLLCRDNQHVALAAPRNHAKSTVCTHSLVLACVGLRKKSHVLVTSATESQAKAFLDGIRHELLENKLLAETIGFHSFLKDTESQLVCKLTDDFCFRIITKSTGQQIRGTIWRGRRPDLIVGDDLESDEIVLNEERRFKLLSWFNNAVMQAGSLNCHYRIVGTILHQDALLARLMPPLDHPETVSTSLKDFNISDKRQWISAKYRAHPSITDYSELLWEERWSAKRLKLIRQGYIDNGMPEGYPQEYLNDPVDTENAIFQESDFLHLGKEEPLSYYISADLAISEKKSRASTAIVVAGLTNKNILRYVNAIKIKNSNSLEIVETLFELVKIYKPEMVIIEKENIASTLQGVINKEMEERNIYFNLDLPVPSKDKVSRARPLQLRMKAGKVEFDTEASWFPELKQDFLAFPRGKNKDLIDACSWIPLRLQDLVSAPTVREIDEAAYDESVDQSYDSHSFGVCSITGY